MNQYGPRYVIYVSSCFECEQQFGLVKQTRLDSVYEDPVQFFLLGSVPFSLPYSSDPPKWANGNGILCSNE